MDQPSILSAEGAAILNVINVEDRFDIDYVAVENLSLDHERMGMLKITLSALQPGTPNPSTVLLKGVSQGGDLQAGLNAATFLDDAPGTIPSIIADVNTPLSGAYLPATQLNALSEGVSELAGLGGSQGSWVLRVVDLGSGRESRNINLQSWSLVLCPTISGDAEDFLDDNLPADSGSGTAADGVGDEPAGANMGGDESASDGQQAADVLEDTLNDRLSQSADGGAETNETMLLDALLERLGNTAIVNNSIIWLPMLERTANNTADLRAARANTNTNIVRNNSVLDRMLDRLDDLRVGGSIGDGSPGRTPLLPRSAQNTSTAGRVFGLAPGQEVSGFIDSLTRLSDISEVAGINASALRAAQAQSANGVDGGRLADQLWGLQGSSGVLASIKNLVNEYAQTLTQSQVLKSVTKGTTSLRDRLGSKVATGTALAGVGANYLKDSYADTLSSLTSKYNVLQLYLGDMIDNYKAAVSSTGSLVSSAIRQYSDMNIADINSLRSSVNQVASIVEQYKSSLSSKTLGIVESNLAKMRQATGGLASIGQGLGGSGSIKKAVLALMDVYATEVSAASDILRATKDSVNAKAINVAEAQIDRLNDMLSRVNDALAKYSQNAGPLVGQSLATYKGGLQSLMTALDGLSASITSNPDSPWVSVLTDMGNGKLTGATLSLLYDSLGMNAPGIKVMRLVGNVNTYRDLYTMLLENL